MAQKAGQATPGAALIGGPRDVLGVGDVQAFVRDQLGSARLDGRSVCVLVPDGTRSCPLPVLLPAIHQALHGRVSRLTVLIALGTHAAMSEQALAAHLGYDPGTLAARYPSASVLNHEWWDSSAFADLGTISGGRIAELSGGLLRDAVPVRINRAVVEHDVTVIVGPVFPHEVAGFSGGNKYLFPGVGGRELIDLSHWLGALITSAEIIGTLGITPVRALIDEAAAMVPGERLAFCVVTKSGAQDLHAVAFGDPRQAWAAAAEVSAQAHIRYLDAPVRRVLSLIPVRYGDMWTGAKGFYKVEPIVADGGQVVLYAPHITEIAPTHPAIEQIGYHCRDYFVRQWDRFSHLHWSDLAHSTHLRGAGTYDDVSGERNRVTVTLATGHQPGPHRRGEPGLPRPGGGRSGRVGGRPGHAGRARRRRGPVPAAVSGHSSTNWSRTSGYCLALRSAEKGGTVAVYEEIRYEVEDPVATITLNRPAVLNAWTDRMGFEVRHAVEQAEHDPRVVGIVITGAGRGFCSGADMNRLSAVSAGDYRADPLAEDLASDPGDPSFGDDLHAGTYTYLMSVPKPVIAAINGPVAGMGVPIVLACDLRFMAQDAVLMTAFAQRGLIAEWGISWLLPRLAGPAVALDLLFSSRKVTGTEAAALRLVNAAVPREEVLAHAQQYVRDLAATSSPTSMAIMKRQVYQQLHAGLAAAEAEARALMRESFSRPDFREGVQSFVQRRAPDFQRIPGAPAGGDQA